MDEQPKRTNENKQLIKRLLLVICIELVGLVILLIMYPDRFETSGLNKPFWDWLDLLIIPVMLGLGALYANWVVQQNEQRRADRENKIEREIASERNQETALQNYLDKMTELLLDKDLRTSKPDDEVRTVARTRTLTVLRGLEKERKTSVMQFLVEANLVFVQEEQEEEKVPIVSLQGANLREADLYMAVLSRANFREADLRGADLRGAHLHGANLTSAILPDGSTWNEGTDMRRFTHPKSDNDQQHETPAGSEEPDP